MVKNHNMDKTANIFKSADFLKGLIVVIVKFEYLTNGSKHTVINAQYEKDARKDIL